MNITKHIPNTITLLNLISGVFGILYAAQGSFVTAFWLMLAAAIFDVLDGLAARSLKAYSPVGKELDSLADLVSFGVLPGLMLYFKMRHIFVGPDAFAFLALLLIPAAALRLARFNVDDRQSHGFLGLPTPATALLTGSLVACMTIYETSALTSLMARSFIVLPVMIYILCRMMLSNISVLSIKNLGKNGENPYGCKGAMYTVFFIPVLAGLGGLAYGIADSVSAGISVGIFTFSLSFIVFNCIGGLILKYR